MRRMVVQAFGSPENLALEEGELAAPGPGEVRIEVHAAGVNFADTLLIRGRYQERPRPPFAPGLEIAGIVRETGPGVKLRQSGDRVLGVMRYGGFADEVVMPEENTYPIHDGMGFETAAAFPVAYGTAHGSLLWKANLQEGETCLILGAAGGVGLAGVEIAKAMGATVIAAAGGPEKLKLAEAHGADHLLDYNGEGLRHRLAEVAPNGIDTVLDTVGGAAADIVVRRLAWEGRFVTVGFTAGKIPAFPANRLLLQNASVHGLYWGEVAYRNPDLVGKSLALLGTWHAENKLQPHLHGTFPLAQAGEALALLLSRKSSGKLVLLCRD